MSNEVAVPTAPVIPALYEPVEQADRQLPSIYLLQGLSQAVQAGLGVAGEVIVGLGADDPEPTFLIGEENDSFVGYILGRRRSFARYLQGGQMEWLDEDEFKAARAAGDRDVWTNWHYVLSVPDVDEFVPMRLMLAKTSGLKAAKNLNFIVDKMLAMGQIPVAKFSVQENTSKQTGSKYYSFAVTATEPTTEGLAVAQQQQGFVGQSHAADDRPALTASSQPDI